MFTVRYHLLMLLVLLCLGDSLLAQPKEPKVLLIGIDGVRGDVLEAANAPNIKGLMLNGTYTYESLVRYPTKTLVGFSSMFTGVWNNKHNLQGNTTDISKFGKYPNFMRRIEEFDPSLKTYLIGSSNFAGINSHINGIVDNIIYVNSDFSSRDNAVNVITNGDPDFLMVYFRDSDHFGHFWGFDPNQPGYVQSVEFIDNLIGDVLAAVQNRPTYGNEDWLIMITTDHGGLDFDHGGPRFEERWIFFLASGDSITNQYLPKDTHLLALDTALQFNSADNYIEPTEKIFLDPQRDFTIELKVRNPGSLNSPMLISNKTGTSLESKGFAILVSNFPGQEIMLNVGDGASLSKVLGSTSIDGEWYHVSATFDLDGRMSIYMNGVPVNSADISLRGDFLSNQELIIGQNQSRTYPSTFGGNIKDIRIWDALLDEKTLSKYIGLDVDANHPYYDRLVAHYKLDENQGALIKDSGPSQNDAMLRGSDTIWSSFPDSMMYFNYTELPEIVDAAYNTLQHLCIPINPAWELDGKSYSMKNCSFNACDSATNLDVDVLGDSYVRLKWDPVPGAHHYVIRGKVKGAEPGYAEWTYITRQPGSPTQFIVNNLAANLEYVWQVQSYCSADAFSFSPFSEPDTFATKCAVPSPIYVDHLAEGSVLLNWQQVENAISYTLFGGALNSTNTVQFTVAGNGTTNNQIDNLPLGTSFQWTVQANCAANFYSTLAPIDTFSIHVVFDTVVTPADTQITQADTTITSGDTMYLPLDTIYFCDTIITPSDTTFVAADTTIIYSDTIIIPADTIYFLADTIYLPGDTTFVVDTIIIDPDTLILNNDTLVLTDTVVIQSSDTLIIPAAIYVIPGEFVTFPIDTFSTTGGPFYFQRPPIMEINDTIFQPADTIVQSNDTFHLAGDTYVIAGDTFFLPGYLLMNTGTLIVSPPDTIYIAADTIYIAQDTILFVDTVIITAADTIITSADTVVLPCEMHITYDTIINPPDTIITKGDTIITAADTMIFIVDTIIAKQALTVPAIPEYGALNALQDRTGRIHVFPNPFESSTTISFNNPDGSVYRFDLYNSAGMLVHSREGIRENSFKFTNTGLPKGLYILQLTGDKQFTGKFVIK